MKEKNISKKYNFSILKINHFLLYSVKCSNCIFSVCGERVALELSRLSRRYSHESNSLPHTHLWAFASSSLFRGPTTLGTLRLSNLPNFSPRHERSVEVFRQRSDPHTHATRIRRRKSRNSLQRLPRGKIRLLLLYLNIIHISKILEPCKKLKFENFFQESTVKFHVVGLKCLQCGSYNTCRIKETSGVGKIYSL